MTCTARQHNDQMCCGRCGLQWDVNDPEPPKCGQVQREAEALHRARAEYIAFVKAVFNVEVVRE